MSDRGVYRGIYSSLLDDPDFQRLSSNARLTLLAIRLCRDTGPAAIFRYYPEVLMRQTGLSARALDQALTELQQGLWIAIEEPIVWVRNGLRYDPMMKPQTNELHRKSIERHVNGLPKRQIVLNFCDYYNIAKPFDSLSIGSRVPLASEDDSEKDSDSEKEEEDERLGRASRPPTNGHVIFKTPGPILAALARTKRLGQAPGMLRDAWWQAELRANPGVDYVAEILKAEAYLEANPQRHYKKLSAFLHNWLARADREEAPE